MKTKFLSFLENPLLHEDSEFLNISLIDHLRGHLNDLQLATLVGNIVRNRSTSEVNEIVNTLKQGRVWKIRSSDCKKHPNQFWQTFTVVSSRNVVKGPVEIEGAHLSSDPGRRAEMLKREKEREAELERELKARAAKDEFWDLYQRPH